MFLDTWLDLGTRTPEAGRHSICASGLTGSCGVKHVLGMLFTREGRLTPNLERPSRWQARATTGILGSSEVHPNVHTHTHTHTHAVCGRGAWRTGSRGRAPPRCTSGIPARRDESEGLGSAPTLPRIHVLRVRQTLRTKSTNRIDQNTGYKPLLFYDSSVQRPLECTVFSRLHRVGATYGA